MSDHIDITGISAGPVVLRATSSLKYEKASAGLQYVSPHTSFHLVYDSKNRILTDIVVVTDLPLIAVSKPFTEALSTDDAPVLGLTKYFSEVISIADTVTLVEQYVQNLFDEVVAQDDPVERSEINGSTLNSHTLGGAIGGYPVVDFDVVKQEAQDASELDAAIITDIATIISGTEEIYPINGRPIGQGLFN